MSNTLSLGATQLVNLAKFVIDRHGLDRKIECIKDFRWITGLGLKESKDIIELVMHPPLATGCHIVDAVRVEVERRRGEWNDRL